MSRTELTLSEARRIALAAQGFDRPRPGGPIGASHIRRAIRQLGLLQLDFVNLLAPSHYLPVFSRLGPYDRSRFDEVVYGTCDFTEQWGHEASILPVETWPLLRHRMENHRLRPYGFETFLERHPHYLDWVLDQVRARGPLTANDLEEPEGIPRRIPGDAWVGTVPRATLEALFGRGALAASDRRPDFSRVYDLAERLIPIEHRRHNMEREEAQRGLLRLAARAHGVGTTGDLAGYYRIPLREARPRISELVDAGELREARVAGWRERWVC